MNKFRRILMAREAGDITRYHAARTIVPESVAHHSHNVVTLLLILTNGTASRELLIAAHLHDLGEIAVGDIPANVKGALSEEDRDKLYALEHGAVQSMFPLCVGTLSPEEEHLLTVCDRLDGLLKCTQELRMGNRHIITIGERYCSYLLQLTEHNLTHNAIVMEFITLFRSEYI